MRARRPFGAAVFVSGQSLDSSSSLELFSVSALGRELLLCPPSNRFEAAPFGDLAPALLAALGLASGALLGGELSFGAPLHRRQASPFGGLMTSRSSALGLQLSTLLGGPSAFLRLLLTNLPAKEGVAPLLAEGEGPSEARELREAAAFGSRLAAGLTCQLCGPISLGVELCLLGSPDRLGDAPLPGLLAT